MEIKLLKDREPFDGFLLLRACEVKASQKGSAYLDCTFADRSGTIGAKVWGWDATQVPPVVGTIFYIMGSGNEFNGRVQLKIEKMSPADDTSGVTMADFVPAAPEDPQVMLREVLETAALLKDSSIRDIVGELLKEACVDDKLLVAPAAKQMHHAELAGLLHHTTGMLRTAKAIAGVYNYLNTDLLYAGVILHDLGKIKEFVLDVMGLVSEYSTDGRLIGHIVRGAMDIERAAEKVGANREQATLLAHMVLSHHGKLEFGSPVLPKIPEAEVLSIIDILDARLFEMRDALKGIEPGGFSAKVWALDNREMYQSCGRDAPIVTN